MGINLKNELKNIIIKSNKEQIVLCDLNNLDNALYKEIYKILFSDNINDVVFLGNILIDSDDQLMREQVFYENKYLKNFRKEIYVLREFIKIIMPIYFNNYVIRKIYKSEKPDFYIEFSNFQKIGIECCSLLATEQYNEIDNKIWKYDIDIKYYSYESVAKQLHEFKKHLENNGSEVLYLFNLGGSARYICAEINNILIMQAISNELKIDSNNIFICIGKSGFHDTLSNGWVKLSEISIKQCCDKLL